MPNVENIDMLVLVWTVGVLFFLFSVFTIIHLVLIREKQRKHAEELSASRKEFEEQLLKAQVELQETIYHRIAQELHDNVGQLLSTTKMLIGVAEFTTHPVSESLNAANATLGEAIQEVRGLSRALDREWLKQFDFLENLRREVARINDTGVVKVVMSCDTEIQLDAEEQLLLFRIVQEAMQNALRHAAPSHLRVEITNSEKLIVKVINDGLPLPATFHGMGTANMQQRAQLFGGSVQWQSQAQTMVTISIPINRSHEN